MVIALGGFADGVYVTVHDPDESVQDVWSNTPPPFPSLHDTELVGTIGELELSVTVAVNVTDPPGDTVAGFGVTDNVVAWTVFIVRLDIPELV
jgi:hypothetical protein